MKTPLIYWNKVCYSGTVDDLPAFCRSYTGRSYRSLSHKCVRGSFLSGSDAGGPLDAPDWLPAGSHCGAGIYPPPARPPMIYPREVQR